MKTCPILTHAVIGIAAKVARQPTDREISDMTDCSGEDCAWWDDQQECCVTMTVAATLIHIAASLKGVIRVRGPQ